MKNLRKRTRRALSALLAVVLATGFWATQVWLGHDRVAAGQKPKTMFDASGAGLVARADTARSATRIHRNSGDCAVKPEDVENRGSSPVLEIDIRPERDFRRSRIPGSLNLRVWEIKAKPYLRDFSILLVSDGYRRLELQEACETLRSEGFRSVHYLEGGLFTWAEAGGDLTGSRSLAELERLPPQAFESEVRRGRWVVIDVSEGNVAAAGQTIEADKWVPFRKEHGSFVNRLADALEEFEEDRFVVLVDSDGSRHGAIGRALGSKRPRNLFLLEGGTVAYGEFRMAQQLMLVSAESSKLECGECRPK